LAQVNMKKYPFSYTSLEEKKGRRKAVLFGILTITSIFAFIFLGLPSLAKFAGFLSDLRKSGQSVEKNDTIPPAPPRLNTLAEVTNQAEIEVSGTAEEGATVVILFNGKSEQVVADRNGKFAFSFRLNNGENFISAKARDLSGNESQESEIYTVIYDDKPPKLEIFSPAEGISFYGTSQRQVTIQGVTESGANLTINDRVIQVEEDGSFIFATTLNEGTNSFVLKAADKAGNNTEKTISVNFSP